MAIFLSHFESCSPGAGRPVRAITSALGGFAGCGSRPPFGGGGASFWLLPDPRYCRSGSSEGTPRAAGDQGPSVLGCARTDDRPFVYSPTLSAPAPGKHDIININLQIF
jgi:hypothetical protein